MIAAVARNGVIGRDGRLPWRLPEDLQHFRRLTTGHCVIMGRRTWESLPHPLANPQNIGDTRPPSFAPAGAVVAHSLDDALAMVERDGPAFCIGGGELYRVALPHADIAYVTEIDCDVDGDATFPPLDPAQWRETAREPQPASAPDGFEYAFVTYERKMNNLR
jgi:dihydrofolate reductase